MPSPRTAHMIAEDLAAGATESLLVLPYYGNDLQIEVAGYVSRLLGLLSEELTAGTLDVRQKLNGTQLATARLAFTTTVNRIHDVTFVSTDMPVAKGDRLGFDAVTSGFAPTTDDLILIVEITPT